MSNANRPREQDCWLEGLMNMDSASPTMMAFAKKASMPSSAPAQVRLRAFEFSTPASGRLTAAAKLWMLPTAPDLGARLSCTPPSKLSSENVLPPLSSMSDPCLSIPLDGSRSRLRTPACQQIQQVSAIQAAQMVTERPAFQASC